MGLRNENYCGSEETMPNPKARWGRGEQTGERRGEHAVADEHAGAEQREEQEEPLQHPVPL